MKPDSDVPRRPFSDDEIRSLRDYARVEGLDAALDVFEGLQEELLALPALVTDDLVIQDRIRAELARITAATAERARAKSKELENGQDH